MVLDGMYKATVIISSILLIVAFVATLLRIYARKLTPSGFFIDDHLIFAALVRPIAQLWRMKYSLDILDLTIRQQCTMHHR